MSRLLGILFVVLALGCTQGEDSLPSPSPSVTISPRTGFGMARWNGYVAPGGTHVAGTFTVPTVSCDAGEGVASLWVGLETRDRAGKRWLSQAGVAATCNGFASWYEFWPLDPVSTQFNVTAGDQIRVEVDVLARKICIRSRDVTTNEANSSCHRSRTKTLLDREWVVESPRWAPLPDHMTATTFTANFPKNVVRANDSAALKVSRIRHGAFRVTKP